MFNMLEEKRERKSRVQFMALLPVVFLVFFSFSALACFDVELTAYKVPQTGPSAGLAQQLSTNLSEEIHNRFVLYKQSSYLSDVPAAPGETCSPEITYEDNIVRLDNVGWPWWDGEKMHNSFVNLEFKTGTERQFFGDAVSSYAILPLPQPQTGQGETSITYFFLTPISKRTDELDKLESGTVSKNRDIKLLFVDNEGNPAAGIFRVTVDRNFSYVDRRFRKQFQTPGMFTEILLENIPYKFYNNHGTNSLVGSTKTEIINKNSKLVIKIEDLSQNYENKIVTLNVPGSSTKIPLNKGQQVAREGWIDTEELNTLERTVTLTKKTTEQPPAPPEEEQQPPTTEEVRCIDLHFKFYKIPLDNIATEINHPVVQFYFDDYFESCGLGGGRWINALNSGGELVTRVPPSKIILNNAKIEDHPATYIMWVPFGEEEKTLYRGPHQVPTAIGGISSPPSTYEKDSWSVFYVSRGENAFMLRNKDLRLNFVETTADGETIPAKSNFTISLTKKIKSDKSYIFNKIISVDNNNTAFIEDIPVTTDVLAYDVVVADLDGVYETNSFALQIPFSETDTSHIFTKNVLLERIAGAQEAAGEGEPPTDENLPDLLIDNPVVEAGLKQAVFPMTGFFTLVELQRILELLPQLADFINRINNPLNFYVIPNRIVNFEDFVSSEIEGKNVNILNYPPKQGVLVVRYPIFSLFNPIPKDSNFTVDFFIEENGKGFKLSDLFLMPKIVKEEIPVNKYIEGTAILELPILLFSIADYLAGKTVYYAGEKKLGISLDTEPQPTGVVEEKFENNNDLKKQYYLQNKACLLKHVGIGQQTYTENDEIKLINKTMVVNLPIYLNTKLRTNQEEPKSIYKKKINPIIELREDADSTPLYLSVVKPSDQPTISGLTYVGGVPRPQYLTIEISKNQPRDYTEQGLGCIDSDGKNKYIRGTTYKDGEVYRDICQGESKVIEYYCENGEVKHEELLCSYPTAMGYSIATSCSAGACTTFPMVSGVTNIVQ